MAGQNLSEDLDYLRNLAEAGERAPLLGGRFYLLWGVLTSFAYAAHYGLVTGMVGTVNWIGFLWAGIVAVGVAGQIIMIRKLAASGVSGSGSAGNQTSIFVWQFAGMALFALFAGLIARIALGLGTPAEFDWSIPVVFALYSVAMGTSGSMAKNNILTGAGWLAAGVFGAAILLVGKPELYLLAAAGIALTAAVPGFLLMRAEPTSTV